MSFMRTTIAITDTGVGFKKHCILTLRHAYCLRYLSHTIMYMILFNIKSSYFNLINTNTID